MVAKVVDMPLLFETGAYKFMWPRILVSCSAEVQVRTTSTACCFFVLVKNVTLALCLLHSLCRQCIAGYCTVWTVTLQRRLVHCLSSTYILLGFLPLPPQPLRFIWLCWCSRASPAHVQPLSQACMLFLGHAHSQHSAIWSCNIQPSAFCCATSAALYIDSASEPGAV